MNSPMDKSHKIHVLFRANRKGLSGILNDENTPLSTYTMNKQTHTFTQTHSYIFTHTHSHTPLTAK